ncbi:MAG: sortase [Eubacterium sp.]|nr:sortase [Eubacterium sp.]
MRKRLSFISIALGLLLIVSAFGLTFYNLWDNSRASREANEILVEISSQISETSEAYEAYGDEFIPDYILNPKMNMPTITHDGHKYIGTISIPVIDLELPVMDSLSYPQLKIAPCRYSGSAYLNNLVIAAHNYTGHFGRLRNLVTGDDVFFTDVDGNVFKYKVSNIETLVPTDVEEMKSGDWDLTVFTCTVGGQTRLAIRCTSNNNS